MGYQVITTSHESYVSIRIIGTWPADTPEIVLDEIYSNWIKHHKSDLLVDISKLYADHSMIREYYTSAVFENVGFQSIRLIAIIDDPSRKNINDILEEAAQNRGLRLRFFYNSEQEANDWFTEQKKIQD